MIDLQVIMTYSYISKYIKELYWAAPFICFLAGYHFLNICFYRATTKAPLLVGKNLTQALTTLSEYNLNMRMIAQKEDPDIPEGTIISQTPRAHSSIRPQQTVFLVVSKKPVQPLVPDVRGQAKKTYTQQLKKLKMRFRSFFLPSNHPEGTCLGQIPSAGQELTPGGILLYVASQDTSSVLMPSFKGKKVKEVEDFLERYSLPFQIYHTYQTDDGHVCKHCVITEQKPLPGSFVSLKEPFSVQLKI